MVYKILWCIKSLFYALLFKKFKFPSYIASPIFLLGTKRVEIHKRVRIYPGVRIETHNGGIIVFEDNVGIGQNFHITAAGKIVIGRNTTISGNVFVTDIDHEYRMIDTNILDQPLLLKETKIGENCFIGYGAAIQAGTILGKHCVVGANSVVRGTFPDYSVIVGAPAKIVKKYNFETKCWEKVKKES